MRRNDAVNNSELLADDSELEFSKKTPGQLVPAPYDCAQLNGFVPAKSARIIPLRGSPLPACVQNKPYY